MSHYSFNDFVIFVRLYKVAHELLNHHLEKADQIIKASEEIIATESNPDDPSATHEELRALKVYIGVLTFTV